MHGKKLKTKTRTSVVVVLWDSQFIHLMTEDSTISHERQIECLSMEQLKNDLGLTYVPRGQSNLITKRVAQQVLRNCPEIFSTYLEIYSLVVEVIMGAEMNELKHFRNVACKGGTKEKQLIERNECQTLMMKFAIFGRTMTSI